MGSDVTLHANPQGRGRRFRSEDRYFTPAIAEEVCERYAMGETLTQICRDAHMPQPGTIRLWTVTNKGGFFKEMFEAAQVLHLLGLADQIIEIADDNARDQGENANAAVYRSKVQIDARKWILAKLLPQKFGDKPVKLGNDRRQLIIELVKTHLPPAEDGNATHPAT